MKYLFAFLSFSCIILLASCSNSDGQDYEAVAAEFCTCLEPIVELNKKMKTLIDAGEQGKARALFPEMQELNLQTEACTKRLKEKHGDMTEADEAHAQKAMAKVCPEVYEMTSAAQVREEE